MRKFIRTVMVLLCFLGTLMFAGCKKESDEGVLSVGETDVSADGIPEGTVEEKEGTITEGQQSIQNQESQAATETDGGGNEFSAEKEEVTKISVLVNKEEYICDNTPMELDEIISKVQEVKGKLIVEVSDNNATLKAYNKLVDQLAELEISVIEK